MTVLRVVVTTRFLLAWVALCGAIVASASTWCLGVLVTPQRALVAAEYAQQATEVVLMDKKGKAVAIQRRSQGERQHYGLLTEEAGVASSTLIVVDLETPVDVNSVLIQLDNSQETQTTVPASSELLLGFSLTKSDHQQQRSDGGKMLLNSFNATIVSLQRCRDGQQNASFATQEAVACVLEQWSDMETCQSSGSHDRVLARVVQGRTYVYAFVVPSTSSSSAVCSSSGTRTAIVRLVTAEFLAHVQTVRSIAASEKSERSQSTESVETTDESSSVISRQEPSSSVVSNSSVSIELLSNTSEPDPTNSPSSSSTSNNESTSEAADETAVSPLQSYLPLNCALLSSSVNASADAFAVAALIAPRFLVANAEWWWSSSTSKFLQPAVAATTTTNGSLWAIFVDNQRVPVRRVWVESEFYTQQNSSSSSSSSSATCDQDKRACSLVVFELERDVSSSIVAPFRVAKSPPPLGVDLDTTQLQVNDLALMRRGQPGVGFSSFARENQSVCRGDPQVPGLQCLDSTDPIETSDFIPAVPFKTSFATAGKGDSLLLGLSDGAEMNLRLGKHVSQSFVELAAAHHRRFLDLATRNSVKWSTIVPAEDESYSQVKSAAVSFYSGRNAQIPMDCGGVAIAPNYILTTASCALSHKISSFSVEETTNSNNMRHNRVEHVQIENAYQVFSHPLYSNSQPLSRYNIALIELQAAALDVYMDLDNEVRGAGIRVSRAEMTSGSWRPEKVQDTGSCIAAGLLRSNADFMGLVCVGEFRQEVDDTVNITRVRASSPSSSLLLHRTMKGVLLVGLELPAPAANSELSVFVSVLAAKQFIGAFASGFSWGPRPQAPKANKVPGLIKQKPKQATTTLLDSQRYVVGLRVTKSGHNFCGGSLVAPTTVLTAAHCVTDGLANWVSVGSPASSGTEAELIRVLSVRVHPLYGSPSTYSYDAAILELAAAAYAPTVALDNSVDFDDTVNGTVFGYGAADTSSDTLSSSVHVLSLQLWSRQSCTKVLPDVDDSFLCAGGKANDDACTGDSGSPLVVTGRDGKDYLAGLVSAGYGCGIEGVPGLYTRTFAIAAFINAYVVQPTWRYSNAAAWGLSGQSGSTSQSSPVTLTPASSVSRPSVTQGSGSQSYFPKLEPRTSAGSGLGDTEEREATGTTPVPVSPQNTTTVATSSIATAALAYQSAISKVTLRFDLSPSVKEAVLRFVLGEYDHTVVSSSLVTQLLDVENQLSFFSSGTLDDLVAVIERHDALPLHRRKNRFGTMGREAAVEDRAEQRCSDGT